MSDTNITIGCDNIFTINPDDGDALLVTLPEITTHLSKDLYKMYEDAIRQKFIDTFKDKNVRVIVVPHGMKIEILQSSLLEDK